VADAPKARPHPEPDDDDGLLLDEIQEQLERTRQLLTEGPGDAADRILAGKGRRTALETRLVGQLADHRPLAHPERFEAAHRLAMQAIEMYDRDGWRNPEVARLGPLSPLFELLAELVAKYIARSFTADAVRAMARLYARREAQAPYGSESRRLLVRARAQTDRVALGYRGGASVVPTALIGGAAVPLLAGLVRAAGGLRLDRVVLLALAGILALVFAAVAYVLLRGAATARRRAKLLCERPLAALWQAIGRAGNPPRDDARTFAAIAIVLTFAAWFGVPLLAGVLTYLNVI
jgi:hypothetical protein